jgi:hypothetical protein
LASEGSGSSQVRTTNRLAFIFGTAAIAAVLLSVFVMASRPWGCSASSQSPLVTCDWVTSRVIAAFWLVAALAVCFVSWRRWKLPLAIISATLVAISLISVIGVFSLAPATLWLGCALWLWARGKGSSIVVSGLASVVLVYLAASGVSALLHLYSTPF